MSITDAFERYLESDGGVAELQQVIATIQVEKNPPENLIDNIRAQIELLGVKAHQARWEIFQEVNTISGSLYAIFVDIKVDIKEDRKTSAEISHDIILEKTRKLHASMAEQFSTWLDNSLGA